MQESENAEKCKCRKVRMQKSDDINYKRYKATPCATIFLGVSEVFSKKRGVLSSQMIISHENTR
jgi:hypothetical protein